VQPHGAVAIAALRPGLTGRKGTPGRDPGIASRAGGPGLTGRNRRVRRWGLCGTSHVMRLSILNVTAQNVGAAFAFWGLVRGRRSRICGLHAFAGPLRFRPVGPVPSAWHEMPGHASPDAVALQGQFLVRNRRERGGMREMLRGGGMVGLGLPRAQCLPPRRFRRRCECEPGHVDRVQPVGAVAIAAAKAWPYRPKGTVGLGPRDCIPGWWTWPYRPEFQGAALGALRDLRRHVLFRHEGDGAKRDVAFVLWGPCAFHAFTRLRPSRIRGAAAFPACKASSISLA
jgi:hypothetical protein